MSESDVLIAKNQTKVNQVVYMVDGDSMVIPPGEERKGRFRPFKPHIVSKEAHVSFRSANGNSAKKDDAKATEKVDEPEKDMQFDLGHTEGGEEDEEDSGKATGSKAKGIGKGR